MPAARGGPPATMRGPLARYRGIPCTPRAAPPRADGLKSRVGERSLAVTSTARSAKACPPFRSLSDLAEAASAATRGALLEFVESGAGAEWTRRANLAAFDAWSLVPRVLRNVREVDLTTRLLGTPVHAPFFASPTAYQGAVHPAGERATARALGRAGILGVYSTLSSRSLEEIASAAPAAPRWFQLYLQPDLTASEELLRRAERAGYSAAVVTVDAPVLGPRDLQSRGGFALDRPVPVGNGPGIRSPARELVPREKGYALEGGAEYSWDDFERLVKGTDLPLVLKGVLRPEDAREAVRRGAKGLLVSNHGGRQLDRALPSLDALPDVVEAIGSRAEVYLDGGVRRAPDILIARALGARAAGLGRPILWALAVGGERGVERLARLLSSELATSLLLLGRRSIAEVDRTAVRENRWRNPPPPHATGRTVGD